MARATKEQSEATAARILDVASTMFTSDGYADVGLDMVATAAGVTRGAVYHHYASKRGLFEAVAALAQDRVGAAVAAAADSSPDPWTGFLAGCRAFLTAILADDRRRILLVDAPSVLGWTAWRAQDAAASGGHLDEALLTLTAAGTIRPASVPAMSALLSGAMNEAALWVARADDRSAALAAAWTDLELLLTALRTPPPAEPTHPQPAQVPR